MSYSLWRNGQLLGELVIDYPTSRPELVAGMFLPAPAFAMVGALMQTRAHIIPGAPVFQSVPPRPFEGDRTPNPDGGRRGLHSAIAVPLQPMSEEEQRGVGPELILEVRDAAGRVIPTDMVLISELPLPSAPAAGPRGQLLEACDALGVDYSGWTLSFLRARPDVGVA